MPIGDEPSVLQILLDQNIPRAIGRWLQESKPEWEIAHTSEVGLDGSTDLIVIQWAQEHEFVVLTFDEDFTDQRGIGASNHHGIIRLRVWPTSVEEIIRALQRLIESVETQEISGALIIVGRNNIRVRPPRQPS